MDSRSPCCRILVVDDNPDAADSLFLLLQLRAYAVFVAYSGFDGVELARSVHPQVCCIDISMPGMDGYEAARLIAAEPWADHIVIIAVTALGAPDENLIEGTAFTRQLRKPFEPERLYELIDDAADQLRL